MLLNHFLCAIFLLLPSAQADSHNVPFIDTRWRVTDVVAESSFAAPERILNKEQYFLKGWSEGIFCSADLTGSPRHMQNTRLMRFY